MLRWRPSLLPLALGSLACGGGAPSRDASPAGPPAADAGGGSVDHHVPSADAGPPPAADDAAATRETSRLDALILSKMAVAQVPGLVAVAVKGDRLLFSKGFGTAKIGGGVAVTPDTLFDVASISKTVLSVLLMKLVEEGRVGLDDDVKAELPFGARNPSFPGDAISYRMLLDHTSSLRDGPAALGYLTYGSDSPIALSAFMQGYVQPGGAYYSTKNWSAASPPGKTFAYSNAGSALAGLLVETVSGQTLQDYSESALFGPLGMAGASWLLDGLDKANIAMPYTVGAHGAYVASGYYCYPDYPSGQLRISGSALGRFLMMLAEGGALGGVRVLSPATLTQMETKQPASLEGLSFEFNTLGGHSLVGHWGVDVGVSTDMWLDPATGAGYLTLTNGDTYEGHYANFESAGPYVAPVQALIDIGTALIDFAESN